jgi:ferredoxin
MKLASDVGKCQGYGNCVAIDEKHFDLDDDGLVVVLEESVTADEKGTAEEAIRSCPVAAIWLEGAQ